MDAATATTSPDHTLINGNSNNLEAISKESVVSRSCHCSPKRSRKTIFGKTQSLRSSSSMKTTKAKATCRPTAVIYDNRSLFTIPPPNYKFDPGRSLEKLV